MTRCPICISSAARNQPAGDNNGFISRVASRRTNSEPEMDRGRLGKVDSLDTPRGLALGSDLLHVADGNSGPRLRPPHRARQVSSVTIPEATSLEFITVHRDGRTLRLRLRRKRAAGSRTPRSTLSLAAVYEVSGIGPRARVPLRRRNSLRMSAGSSTDDDALYFVEGSPTSCATTFAGQSDAAIPRPRRVRSPRADAQRRTPSS
jgi:hypothetical protein